MATPTPLPTTMTVEEAIDAGRRVPVWRLFHELVHDRNEPLSDVLRAFVFSPRMSAIVVLHDPALLPGENWLRISESGREDFPLFLAASAMDTKPGRIRYYVPAEDGVGFRAEAPRYEGHWRATFEETSELPWPTQKSGWKERGAFLQKLAVVEASAYRIAYRGFSRCRICGRTNGHEALRLDCWEWPAGFRHYIQLHEVRPSSGFVEFIHVR